MTARYKGDPVNLVYDQMAEQQLKQTMRTTSKHFRASEADKCKRQLFYRISGYRPAPNDGWLEHLGIQGDIDHDTTRDMFRHYGAELGGLEFNRGEDGEVTVKELEAYKKDFDVDGLTVTVACRADGLIYIPELLREVTGRTKRAIGKGRALLEVKGMDGWSWNYCNKAFVARGMDGVKEYILEKKRAYVWQMTTTMALVGEKFAYLLVKDRSMAQHGFNNPDTGERIGGGVWEFDEDLWQRILGRFAAIKRAVTAGVAPRAEFAPKSKQCDQCGFRYLCHDAVRREAAGIEPFVKYPVEDEEDFHASASVVGEDAER